MTGKPGQQPRKAKTLTKVLAVDPGRSMDRRFLQYKLFAKHKEDLLAALPEPSPQQLMLIERASALHIRLQQLEQEYLAGQGLDAGEFSQLTGTLLSVLKALGLHRRAKRVEGLHDYMARKATCEVTP